MPYECTIISKMSEEAVAVSSQAPEPLTPEEKESDGPAREMYLQMEADDETYVESVLVECKRVSYKMIYRLFFSIGLFLLVILIQALSIWNSDRIYAMYRADGTIQPQHIGEKVAFNMTGLYDHVQVLFNSFNDSANISMHHIDATIAALLFLVILKAVVFSPLSSANQIFIRFMFLMSQVYFIRGIFILATVVPQEKCDIMDLNAGFFAQYLHVLRGYLSITRTCTDMIISGHTAATIILAQVFIVHNRGWHLNTIVAIISATTCFLLVVTRMHYTVDIMFGILLALCLYHYHIHVVAVVGRITLDPEYAKYEPMKKLYKLISKFEMTEERLRLFLKLQQLKRMELPGVGEKQKRKMEYYCTIFGVYDDVNVEAIYRGFDLWTTGTFKLISKRLRLPRKERKGEDPDTPSTEIETPKENV